MQRIRAKGAGDTQTKEAIEVVGRKAVIGLALACALGLCGIGGASASAATHTTAFTCVPGGTGFKDAHCDEPTATGGSFGHTAIAANTSREIIGSNNTTGSETSSWALTGKISSVQFEITCASVRVMGSIENNTTSEAIKGSGTIEMFGTPENPAAAECTLLKPESLMPRCKVTVPSVSYSSKSEAMGTKFSPSSGTILAQFTISKSGAESCSLAGTYNIEGTMSSHGILEKGACGEEVGVASGATMHFTREETEKTLTFAGNAAALAGTLTLRMGPTATPGNPIAATTLP